MKILKPVYYAEFKCIGSECIDTCCKDWQIQIDKKSYLKYRKTKGEFSKKLNDSVVRNRKNGTELFYAEIKLKEDKCPLLNEKKLCGIYINLGEEYLCNTCKIYPRLIRKYGDIYERTLSLSCPEVARILVETNEDISFNMGNENLNEVEQKYIVKGEYNKELYNLLWKGRDLSIEVAQFKEIPIWKRLIFLKIIEKKLQILIDESKYNELNNTIVNLTNIITNYDVIKSLDNINKVNRIKIQFIHTILQRRANCGKTNNKFLEILDDFNCLFGDKNETDILEILDIKENRFNEYFKEYENIFENYIVYNLYNYYMQVLKTRDLNKEILMLILKYSIIKILLLAKWNKQGERLNKKDIIDVLYSFSRVMEHNDKFIDDLCIDIKKEEYDSLAYLTILVR
ncbi:TPA: flagellin lysine-N-methylase [Clostridium botulinum]|uniref:flagellin lysine-N-methylase n=1 Tax=Clostridium botulinum TaxID=1491 RepID=UPI0029AF3B77|nr:flagellin lysine-N-methylase [Clostridium botulinum]HDK7177430.1 flagellin lysine-N-methylase [Clostridium botulinum]HDK7189051.1 flagellin lysine-N-methylase [Clostridium botulinum]HDK7216272.1 flagellin lysine-N-methylase [Clostridium botulinum]HDK7222914.1 flagellin lysine-N-methylase [Clostridium botulinum]